MQLGHIDYRFTLLTPCFSGTALGKEDDHAEMRIPPIRGHVRFWHRALFDAGDCNRVWGSASGNEGRGSRVSVRFVGSVSTAHADSDPPLLPHKGDPHRRGWRPALAAGTQFSIRLQRLVGCTDGDWDHAQRAVKLWLLLGGLGLRSNRAAGSVWPIGDWVPRDRDALKLTLQELELSKWSVALIGEGKGKTSDDLRKTASDTLAGRSNTQVFGGINPRKPSPTRFKVIKLGENDALLAVAPSTYDVRGEDGQQRSILREAERLLLAKPNPARWTALGPWNHLLP
jgi:hypothetical protein